MVNQSHCPVCKMLTDEMSLGYEYQKVHFSFCSEQCRQRFIANPNLYFGQPGKPSVGYQNKSIIKQRVLYLDKVIPDDVVNTISESLMTMMGIKDVQVTGNKINISYDLLEATIEQIEAHIEQMGQHISNNWLNRLRNAFIQYSEETELDNLEQAKGHSCHNMPEK